MTRDSSLHERHCASLIYDTQTDFDQFPATTTTTTIAAAAAAAADDDDDDGDPMMIAKVNYNSTT